MGTEGPGHSWKTSHAEGVKRDAIRANVEREKKEQQEHENFKLAILKKIGDHLDAFAKEHSMQVQVTTPDKDMIWFRCKEDSQWKEMSKFLDSKIAFLSEKLMAPDGAQAVIYPEKDPANRVFKITVRG